MVPVFADTLKKAADSGSRYRGRAGDRTRLTAFIDANGWFGHTPVVKGDEIYMPESQEMNTRIRLWLKAYGHTDREKTQMLLDAFRDRFPDTCRGYEKLIRESPDASARTDLRVLDYILSELEKDITGYDEDGLQPLLRDAPGYLDAVGVARMIAFISGLDGFGIKLAYRYQVSGEKKCRQDTSAYSLEEFARMAYFVFNKDSWQENSLVEKAASNRCMADMWLFVAMHFVCALRAMDICRLPPVRLPARGDVVREAVLSGSFTEAEAAGISRSWIQEIGLFRRPPGKTADKRGIPSLKVFIPHSVEAAFGIILVMAASHHEGMFLQGKACVLVTRSRLLRFFGQNNWPVGKRRGFQSRRANKAYMQGIAMVAGEDPAPGRAKGYMLAALARGHKGGIGRLPLMTETYLKDASFTGQTPEFVLREMFERGIFGFVPVLLLEMADRRTFRALPVRAQTDLVLEVGLEAWQVEKLASAMNAARDRARKAVMSVFMETGKEARERFLWKILHKIASDEAPAKHDFFLCVRTAAGGACPCQERSSCIGCGAEVYTKEALRELVSEYMHLCRMYRESSGWEALRMERMLEEGIMPAIAMVVESIPRLYPETDISEYLGMVEEGMLHAGTAGKRD